MIFSYPFGEMEGAIGRRSSLNHELGLGTAAPVLAVAFLLAYSANSAGRMYNVLSKVGWSARMITGWLFILAGIWFSLTYVFEVR